VLRVLNSRWWLPDLLNVALGAERFRRQYHRQLKIKPWENRPKYPRRLLPWDEGSTQVDWTVRWENPPTTVYVEMKYGSGLSMTTSATANGRGNQGYPSDQLIRNIRTGLLECGWFDDDRLFELPPRDFVVILCAPTKGHRLVRAYRSVHRLRAAIPHSNRLVGLPALPFVGELDFGDIVRVLKRQRVRFSRPERQLVDSLAHYLAFKRSTLRHGQGPGQAEMDFPE
jgi:hypothetical protein